MKKLLIHLHVYYHEQLSYFLQKIGNICNVDYDLYVTMHQHNPAAESKVLAFFPDAKILIVENRGYDVGAFVEVLNHVNLAKYDYVLKLHTKKNTGSQLLEINKSRIARRYWSRMLIEALIDTPQIWLKNLQILAANSKVGMIAAKKLITSETASYEDIKDRVVKTVSDFGFSPLQSIRFVAGTMFLIRAELLKPLQQARYSMADFEIPDPKQGNNSLAHVMDRVFGAMVEAQNHTIYGQRYMSFSTAIGNILARIRHFIYYKKNSNGVLHIKIFGLPVWRKKEKIG